LLLKENQRKSPPRKISISRPSPALQNNVAEAPGLALPLVSR
jgi:hypothetical protein